MDDLNTLSASNLGLIVVVLGVVCVLLLLALAILARRVGRIDRRLSGMTRGADGTDLSEILEAHLDKVYAVARDLDEVARRTTALEAAQPRAFQRIGLVRFNPFEDTGGNQSFAVALLDGRRRRVRDQQPALPVRHAGLRQGGGRGQVGHGALGRGGPGRRPCTGLRSGSRQGGVTGMRAVTPKLARPRAIVGACPRSPLPHQHHRSCPGPGQASARERA